MTAVNGVKYIFSMLWLHIFRRQLKMHNREYKTSNVLNSIRTIERIQANLGSSNPAVVLSAVKVIIRYLDFITDP